jgi:hypothetical protein
MTRKQWRAAPRVPSEFDSLRFLPPHVLLAALHRHLVLEVSRQAGGHYEGLSQAARDSKHLLGNSLVNKLKVIDEAAHLIRHLSPESSAVCYHEVCKAFRVHGEANQTSLTSTTTWSADGSMLGSDSSIELTASFHVPGGGDSTCGEDTKSVAGLNCWFADTVLDEQGTELAEQDIMSVIVTKDINDKDLSDLNRLNAKALLQEAERTARGAFISYMVSSKFKTNNHEVQGRHPDALQLRPIVGEIDQVKHEVQGRPPDALQLRPTVGEIDQVQHEVQGRPPDALQLRPFVGEIEQVQGNQAVDANFDDLAKANLVHTTNSETSECSAHRDVHFGKPPKFKDTKAAAEDTLKSKDMEAADGDTLSFKDTEASAKDTLKFKDREVAAGDTLKFKDIISVCNAAVADAQARLQEATPDFLAGLSHQQHADAIQELYDRIASLDAVRDNCTHIEASAITFTLDQLCELCDQHDLFMYKPTVKDNLRHKKHKKKKR